MGFSFTGSSANSGYGSSGYTGYGVTGMDAAPSGSSGGGYGDPYGAIIGAVTSAATTYYQNEEAKKEATRNRNFQRDMANTAHQRELADLKAAGLNPMLAVTGGSGAATPSGGMAPIENIGAPAIATAMDAMRLKKDISMAEQQMANQTKLADSTEKLQAAQTFQSAATAKNAALNNEILQSSIPALKTEAGTRYKKAQFDRDTQVYDSIIEKVKSGTQAVGGIMGLVPNVNSARQLPSWQGVGKDGTRYHKTTGEILP